MRKFNLKENAAKRMIGMQKAGLSEKAAYADIPEEQTPDTGIAAHISPRQVVISQTMKPPMYYLSCRLAQAGDLMQWKSRCEAESYIRISDKNDRRAVYCSEETIGSIREIMNDEIFDGMKLFFSFVEFREIEQEIVFTVAEVEDGLNTGISSLDHYLFSLIGVQ